MSHPQPQWRIRDLQELCARRVVACLSQGDATLGEQLQYLPPAALEGLWAFAAETDRLTDALVRAALNRESLLDAVELGRVPLGVTERGLRRGLRALPPTCESIRVGWPAHFGPPDWLVQALYARSREGTTPLVKLELRAAGLGGGQGGVVPTHWTRTGSEPTAERPDVRPSSALLGRARAAAHSEEARLLGVADGAIKSMLRSSQCAQGGLEVLSIAGAREAEGRFADALRTCAPRLRDLRFRDAPLVGDDAAAALIEACASTLEAADVSRTGAGPRCAGALAACVSLRRCAVDGCDLFGDDALDTLLNSAQLEELSCRRCPKLTAGACWRSCATLGVHLRRLRCDLRRGGVSRMRARRVQALRLLASDASDSEESLDAAAASTSDDLPPFDAAWRGTSLAFLSCALVGFEQASVRDVWLQALLAKLPASLVDLDVRGSWDGAVRPLAASLEHVQSLLPHLERLGGIQVAHVVVRAPEAAKFASLKAVDIACAALTAADVDSVLSTLHTLQTASLKATTATAAGDAGLKALQLETLDLEGLRFGTLLLDRLPKLRVLRLTRCAVQKIGVKRAPQLNELAFQSCAGAFCGPRGIDSAAPERLRALRRLRAPSDSFAAAFARTGTALKSLTMEESMVSVNEDHENTARATLGGVLRARAATRAAYLGLEAPHLDGLVSLELLRARDFTGKHFAALPLACPALRRLRLVACANCRGALASDTQLPPPTAASDRRLSATSDGHFGEMTPVKDDDDSDDDLFAMDDERPERNPSTTPGRRLAFDEGTRSPSPRRRAPSLEGEDAVPPRRRSPSPARAMPPRRNKPKGGERFDALLQCWVCGHTGEGRTPSVLRSLAQPRSAEYRRFRKIAAGIPVDKRTGLPVCARFLAGRCVRGNCEFAHQNGGNKKRVRALLDLLDEVDSYRQGDWWAAPDQCESDDNSTDGLSRSPPSSSSPASSSPRSHVHDFGGRARPALRFENLEALELDGCRHVDQLMLDGPRLLALALPRCDGLSVLNVVAPRATHLDCSGCTRLRRFPLPPGCLPMVAVASLAHCQRLDAPFLSSFVDHCRHLTHLNVYGAALAEREASHGSRVGYKKSKGAGTMQGDPTRVKRSTRAGLCKLTAGRPHLEVVKTRKEHEMASNATRTTLDLRLS